ncbi:MAG: PQQ-binding-like beta-propeller repeat protein [Planctomycetota bacterium]|nr:PQQ-binding-like beta-propeller repeat protein [Planctomycetota bacterium]
MLKTMLFALMLGAVCGAMGAAAEAGADAREIVQASGARTGLCVVVGCGQPGSAELCADLAEATGMLVHGLALDDAGLERARAAIGKRGVAGRATVERWTGKGLPFLNDLARLVVVEGPVPPEAGIARAELLRILAPAGALCSREGGKWQASVKPRPSEMDEWAQPHHGADGNMVSDDKVLRFPLGLRWLDGVASGRGGFAACAGTRAVVLAGGRLFTVSLDDRGSAALDDPSAYLLARDAFCGMPLWKFDCETTWSKVALDWRNVCPIVATGKHVYTLRKDALVMLDAATGRVEAECATKHPVRRLVLEDGCLIAACWEKLDASRAADGFENDNIRAVWWPGGGVSLEAFDAGTAKPRWSLPLGVLTLLARDKTAYVLASQGNPPTERAVVALDLATGKEKWRVPHAVFGDEPDLALVVAGPDCVAVAKTKNKNALATFVLDAADGKIRFKLPNSVARCIVGGQLWCHDGRYDLKTGRKEPGQGVGATYAGSNIVGGCVPPIVVGGKYVTGSRGCAYLELPEAPGKSATTLTYRGARGACIQGMIPANGMFYTAQNNCACNAGQVPGFVAAGPADEPPDAEAFARARPVEKGPAFGHSGPGGEGDWPTYRQNAERSGGSGAAMPARLKVLWKTSCAKRGEGPFADAWDARIGRPQPLTAPVVAAGKVVVAGVHAGELKALDPATGATLWTALLGSRIDTPPTFYKGLLLAGCGDGWVYALRAADGALAYRVRIAPEERRMVAYGQVESVWPAAGAVLVYDGVAYASAGRSTQTDGGIALVAFKPESGETLWAKPMGAGQSFLNDVLSVQDNELVWHWMRLDLKTGAPLAPTQRYVQSFGMLDASWCSGFSKRSGRGFVLGKACANMMTWNDRLVVSAGYAVAREKVALAKPDPKAAAKHPDAFKKEELAWSVNLEPETAWARVHAMAQSDNAVYFAGSVYRYGTTDIGAFLWMKSTKDGASLQPPVKLDAPPGFDGLALAGGRLYLSLQDGSLVCLGE